MSDCTHKTADDFSAIGHTGVRIWTCSHCGHTGAWGPTWGYYGSIECVSHYGGYSTRSGCGMAEIDWVACSDACAEALS